MGFSPTEPNRCFAMNLSSGFSWEVRTNSTSLVC